MSKKAWVWGIIVVIIVAGGAFWGGMTYAASKTPSAASRFAGASGTFAGRTGAAGFTGAAGGGTVGTVIAVSNGTFTVQLPSSTSTTATTGTKLVLVDNATEIDELESVPVSNIQVGQTVTVAGTTNSDGSVTASSVMIRPATTRTGTTGSTGATTQTSTSGE